LLVLFFKVALLKALVLALLRALHTGVLHVLNFPRLTRMVPVAFHPNFEFTIWIRMRYFGLLELFRAIAVGTYQHLKVLPWGHRKVHSLDLSDIG
jgi:hypothetical protein